MAYQIQISEAQRLMLVEALETEYPNWPQHPRNK